MTDVLRNFLSRLEKVRRAGEGFSARCPAHDDGRNSLSVSDGDTGVVLHCHAGCDTGAVLRAIDLKFRDLAYETSSLTGSAGWTPDNLETDQPPAPKSQPRVVAEYEYRDPAGELVYVVERRDPKDFRQRRPDGAGGWIRNLEGIARLPYRLPELLAAPLDEPLFIVEGEKDVDTLRAHGFTATCNSGGAGKWSADWPPGWFADRHIVAIPDDDEPGRKHVERVAQLLAPVAASFRTLPLPAKDASDWFAAGHTPDDLRALLAAPTAILDTFEHMHGVADPPAQRWVVDKLIPKGFITTLYAHGGSSKSFLAVYMAMRVTLGLDIFGHAVEPGPVLFLDGELDRDTFARRSHMLLRGSFAGIVEQIPHGIFYRKITKSLLDPALRDETVKFIRANNIALTFVDSFSACLPGDDTNSLDDVTRRMRALEDFGSVFLIDHMAKGADLATNTTAIGSVAKMMFCRSALQIAAGDDGTAVLQHKKANFGPMLKPIPYEVKVDPSGAYISPIDANDERLEKVASTLPAKQRLEDAFRRGRFDAGARVGDIADALTIPLKTVKNKLTDLSRAGIVINDGGVWRPSPTIAPNSWPNTTSRKRGERVS